MYINVNFNKFMESFIAMGRAEQFSIDGLKALFNYLEDLEQGIGAHFELDVLSLCCEFTEDTWQNVADNYNIQLSAEDSDEDKIQQIKDFLECESIMIGYSDDKCLTDLVIYQQF